MRAISLDRWVSVGQPPWRPAPAAGDVAVWVGYEFPVCGTYRLGGQLLAFALITTAGLRSLWGYVPVATEAEQAVSAPWFTEEGEFYDFLAGCFTGREAVFAAAENFIVTASSGAVFIPDGRNALLAEGARWYAERSAARYAELRRRLDTAAGLAADPGELLSAAQGFIQTLPTLAPPAALLSIRPVFDLRRTRIAVVSDVADQGGAGAAELCIWPGCTRPRAPGRAAGSGRQKEYCLQADPPERGGSPVHNARNRWAALRAGAAGLGNAAVTAGPAAGTAPEQDGAAAQPADGDGPAPFSGAKRRADELLAQARRQHAAALAGLRAELDAYEKAGAELAALADPAALDLEIATIAARAGRQVAQAEDEAAGARRAQLTAQRERDEAVRLRAAADAAAEQLEQDAAEAERALAERTAAFERDLADLVSRARAAEAAQTAAQDQAVAVRAEADAEVGAARDAARREAAEARSRADELVAAARRDAAAAVAEARERAAREQALLEEHASAARAEADRARADAADARRSADDERQEARAAQGERDAAQAAAAAATAATAAAEARAAEIAAQLAYARDELSRLREAHAGELARLTAAGDALLDAERARANRAEAHAAGLRAPFPGTGTPSSQ